MTAGSILIHGAGFANKGAEAMLRTVQVELTRRIPGASFCMRVLPRDVDRARDAGVEPLTIRPGKVGALLRLGRAALTDRRLAGAALRSLKRAAILPSVRHAQAMVDVSGFSLSDAWGPGNAKNHLSLTTYLSSRGRPSVYLPQAWGPFSDPRVARLTAALCRRVRLAYARDEESLRHLEALPAIPRDSIGFAYDIAFRFAADPPEVGSQALQRAGLPVGDTPLVGIVPNMRVYERSSGRGIENAYVRALSHAVGLCADRLGARVVLIPHEISTTGAQDDRHLCDLIHSLCGAAEHAAALTEDRPAAEIKSVINHLDLVISSRYHALIAALSQRVPAVALGWSHKYDELMRAAGLAEYACPWHSVDEGSLLELIPQAWHARARLRQTLLNEVPAMERSADAALDRTAEIVLEAQG